MSCAICAAEGRRWMTQGNRELWRCVACDFAWVPQGVMLDHGVSIYEHERPIFLRDGNEAYYLDDNNRANARAKLEWVAEFRNGGRLLDVGANFGHFVAEASTRYDVLGLEPSRVAAEWAQANLQARVEPGSVYDLDPTMMPPFEVVTMWDVIEHLSEPRTALERVCEMLAPGGILCLATPDMGSLASRLMGRQWHYLDLVQHVSLFNRRNLTTLLASAGFRVLGQRTFGRIYRTSYVRERIEYFAHSSNIWRVTNLAARPILAVAPAHVSLNLGDVMAIVAERRR